MAQLSILVGLPLIVMLIFKDPAPVHVCPGFSVHSKWFPFLWKPASLTIGVNFIICWHPGKGMDTHLEQGQLCLTGLKVEPER